MPHGFDADAPGGGPAGWVAVVVVVVVEPEPVAAEATP
jgi:hypothetical protein